MKHNLSIPKAFLFGLLLIIIVLAAGNAKAEHQIKVVVIDTGYTENGAGLKTCDNVAPPKDIAGSQHGSNVAGLIAKNVFPSNNVCFIILQAYKKGPKGELEFSHLLYFGALRRAIDLRVDFINLSLSGGASIAQEEFLIKQALDLGITVVAAAGNSGLDLNKLGCIVYPACIDPRIIVVGNADSVTSNLGRVVDVFEPGNYQEANKVTLSGTSQAAALHTAYLVNQMLKIKEAVQ